MKRKFLVLLVADQELAPSFVASFITLAHDMKPEMKASPSDAVHVT